MTQTELKASDHLDAAADYIEEHGLYKGWYWEGFKDPEDDEMEVSKRAALYVKEGKTPKCCVSGALAIVGARSGVDSFSSRAFALRNYLYAATGVSWWEIPDWNDKPSQRKSRVVKTLRKAAGLARKDGK